MAVGKAASNANPKNCVSEIRIDLAWVFKVLILQLKFVKFVKFVKFAGENVRNGSVLVANCLQ